MTEETIAKIKEMDQEPSKRLYCTKCDRHWEYKGKAKRDQYTSCPLCKASVKVSK